uniref:Uncharacterized protein n=1 Tax=Pithovirus LCPAC102 TaxID=2506587 RepID=A0A481Z462_9VIRU|nr:MAG: uncharacterized protein LCPAC102_00840 [Pithovirus LCPAC102]
MNEIILSYINSVILYIDKIRLNEQILVASNISIPQIVDLGNNLYNVMLKIEPNHQQKIMSSLTKIYDKYNFKHDLINILNSIYPIDNIDIKIDQYFIEIQIVFNMTKYLSPRMSPIPQYSPPRMSPIQQYSPPRMSPKKNMSDIKITKEIIDQLSILNLDMDPVDRSIDQTKVNNYLNSIQDFKIKEITQLIIDNTTYINFNTLKNELIKQVNKLPNNINILFDTRDKVGSEHWLIVLIWPWIKNKVIKVINTFTDIDNDYPILIIDDAIYSGHYMMGVMDMISYEYKQFNNISWNAPFKNKFIGMVAYASKNGIEGINRNSKYMGADILIYTDNIIANISQLIPNYNNDYMHKNFGIENDNVPIYFDHKIAGKFSSFPNIYKHIVKELPSRYKIEELEQIILSL